MNNFTRRKISENIKNLTTSEKIIFNHLIKGHTNTKISKELFVSPSTIKFHKSSIYKKLGVKSIHDLKGFRLCKVRQFEKEKSFPKKENIRLNKVSLSEKQFECYESLKKINFDISILEDEFFTPLQGIMNKVCPMDLFCKEDRDKIIFHKGKLSKYKDFKRDYIRQSVKYCGGDLNKASLILGISGKTIRKWIS